MQNLINFFKAAPTNGKKLDVSRVISEGAKRGYIIHPDCCTEDVLKFIQAETFNPNTTFYKTWKDVTDKSRFELLIDQLLHYATTYGTNFQGNVYCPNGEPIEIDYNTYTVIQAVSPREFYDMCVNCVASGIALAETTLNSILDYIITGVKENGYPLDLETITNRDAQCILADELGLFPTSGQAIICVLFYKVFGNPMPIQGHAQLNSLLGVKTRYGKTGTTANVDAVDLSKLTSDQLIALSTVFYRYKKFLLGLKKNPKNKAVVNKLRRLAKSNHQPMTPGFWENITNWDRQYVAEHLESELAKLDNNFKIARLIQMFELRALQNKLQLVRTYIIRNGKVWQDKNSIAPYAGWWESVKQALILRLIENLKVKRESINAHRVYVKFPERLSLACPVSEKKFLGNIPFGSTFDLNDADNFFGVYWRNEWGTRDYDLSFLPDDGSKIGWNSDYYNKNQSLVFSGDMTSADPEATEMFYARGNTKIPNGVLMLNRFSGNPNSEWRLFFGQEKILDLTKGYMVNPNNIQFSEMGKSTAKQQLVGQIQNNKLVVCVLDLNEQTVSYSDQNLNEAFGAQAASYLPLKDILLRAGFLEYNLGVSKQGIQPTIDLTDLKKDTLLNLFS